MTREQAIARLIAACGMRGDEDVMTLRWSPIRDHAAWGRMADSVRSIDEVALCSALNDVAALLGIEPDAIWPTDVPRVLREELESRGLLQGGILK